MIEQAKDTFGGLHAIVNPAGILRDTMFHKMTEEDWDTVIDVHLRGSFNVTRASIELFREQKDGAYVLFTSTSGLIGNIGQANYAAAKMGIVGLSRIVAMEGARNNVRSNVIAPFAWTRMIESIPVKDEASAQRVGRMRDAMRADQVAQLAVALCADARKTRHQPDFRCPGQRDRPVRPAPPDPLHGGPVRLESPENPRYLPAGHGDRTSSSSTPRPTSSRTTRSEH